MAQLVFNHQKCLGLFLRLTWFDIKIAGPYVTSSHCLCMGCPGSAWAEMLQAVQLVAILLWSVALCCGGFLLWWL